MKTILLLCALGLIAGCGISVSRQCTVDAKKEYQSCVTTLTDEPVCIGSCATKGAP
jgi:hypothetical protein